MRRPVAAPQADPLVRHERQHTSNTPATRTEAQRDRDRILYSSAFLRLGQITQVVSADPGRTFHSRLTHSLKVAQVARRLAERLTTLSYSDAAATAVAALDVDAVEACALAHDLGHPPFGHLAEEELDKQAGAFGGFEGNAQSFRILTRLALRDVEHPGLNLTRQTLNGVLKYPWLRDTERPDREKKWGAYGADQDAFIWARNHDDGGAASLEARIMDWADDVTYAVHDMDDFYRVGLIPLEGMRHKEEAFSSFVRYVSRNTPDLTQVVDDVFTLISVTGRYEGRIEERARLRALGSFLITRYINAFKVVDGTDGVEVEIDDQCFAEVTVLKQLIWFYVIGRPSLATVQYGQRRLIRELAEMYLTAATGGDDRLFPPVFRQRLERAETEDARRRVAIDLIAGMTEDSAYEVYRRATGATIGSLLSAPQI